VLIYIVTFAFEVLRSMVLSTPSTPWAKIKNWHSKYWNLFDTLCVTPYFVAFFLRSYGLCLCGWYSVDEERFLGASSSDSKCKIELYDLSLKKEDYLYGYSNQSQQENRTEIWQYNAEIKKIIGYGRAIYCLNTSLWIIRIFKFCSVNKTLGQSL